MDAQHGPEPSSRDKLARDRPLRVVAIGGGTGLSTLLKGLKRFAVTPAERGSAEPSAPSISELCAVVTVSDDGGSSGRLRKEFNMLPPGDIRNCVVALSEDEALLSRLFSTAFKRAPGSKATTSATFSSRRLLLVQVTSPEPFGWLLRSCLPAAIFSPPPP